MTTGPIVRGALVALTFVTLPASRAEAMPSVQKAARPATTTYYAPSAAYALPDAVKRSTTWPDFVSHGVCQCPVTTVNPMPAVDGAPLPGDSDAACVTLFRRRIGALYVVSSRGHGGCALLWCRDDRGVLHSGRACGRSGGRVCSGSGGSRPLLWRRRAGNGGANAVGRHAVGRTRRGGAQPGGSDSELSQHAR
jgi:hypothetical protein